PKPSKLLEQCSDGPSYQVSSSILPGGRRNTQRTGSRAATSDVQPKSGLLTSGSLRALPEFSLDQALLGVKQGQMRNGTPPQPVALHQLNTIARMRRCRWFSKL